jgi:hypothetical protein
LFAHEVWLAHGFCCGLLGGQGKWAVLGKQNTAFLLSRLVFEGLPSGGPHKPQAFFRLVTHSHNKFKYTNKKKEVCTHQGIVTLPLDWLDR